MDKKENQDGKPVEETTEDNLEENPLKVLEDFNASSLAADKETQEEAKSGKQEAEGESEADWLIENKFRNDDKGRNNLIESYQNIQGRATKAEAALKGTESLQQLDEFLRENPNIVKLIQREINTRQNGSKVPEKPEDYDMLDESIEGTSSYKWREQHDEYLVQRGAAEALKEVNAFKQELAEKDAINQRTKDLMKLGLTKAEITEYDVFIQNPKHKTEENLVKVWRYLSGKESSAKESKEAVLTKEGKQTTAAAISGAVPAQTSDSKKKAEEEIEAEIMKLSTS